MKKFSIIVPIYNVEKYLDKCISSLINQTYDNIEILLINDGSTDSSEQICKKWINNEKVRYFKKINGGLSSARNYGIDNVSIDTDYIIFVDSDDYVRTDLCELVNNNLLDDDLLNFSYYRVTEDNIDAKLFKNSVVFLNNLNDIYDYILHSVLNYKIPWEAWSKVYKYKIIKNNNLYFEDGKRIFAEDILFFLKYLFYCKNITTLSDPLYFYVQRKNSIMGKSKNDQINYFEKVNALSKSLQMFILDNCNQINIKYYSKIHCKLIVNELTRLDNLDNSKKNSLILKNDEYHQKMVSLMRKQISINPDDLNVKIFFCYLNKGNKQVFYIFRILNKLNRILWDLLMS